MRVGGVAYPFLPAACFEGGLDEYLGSVNEDEMMSDLADACKFLRENDPRAYVEFENTLMVGIGKRRAIALP